MTTTHAHVDDLHAAIATNNGGFLTDAIAALTFRGHRDLADKIAGDPWSRLDAGDVDQLRRWADAPASDGHLAAAAKIVLDTLGL